MTVLTELTAADARRLLDAREVSAVELTDAHFARYDAVEPALHCHLHSMADVARVQAVEADKRIAAGESAGLTGIPISLKDVLCTVDAPTTAASRILAGYRSPYDATVVRKLREQGAVFIGKSNTDEFAMGSSTENSSYGVTRNPWNPDRVPGGSSGGPAAAVAAGEAIASLGSDTGGSIRQPAGFCGVVGLKPTYGRVSRYGLLAFASSLDQIGPFTRTVEDSAILLEAIAGNDPSDSTSVPIDVPAYSKQLGGGLRGVRIGVAQEYAVSGMEPGVDSAVKAAIALLEREGAKLVPVSLPHTKYALPTYYITAPAEASANLSRYDGVKYGYSKQAGSLREMYEQTRGEGFGSEVKRRIMLGTYALSSGYYDAYYVKAQQVRTLILRDYDRAFEIADVVAMPTSPTPPFRLGERTSDPLQMYLGDVFTVSANLAGLPAVSIPCGFTTSPPRLPIGLQLTGRRFDEATLLRMADAYERDTAWWMQAPPTASR
jgi:aspartyl-tRNA(Asn)/glutamyl-tRNA(Gln) amidotransferase subunit A